MSAKPKAKGKAKAAAKARDTPSNDRFGKDNEAKNIRIPGIAEAARTESMWVGSHDVADHVMYLIDRDGLKPRFTKSTISISSACMKCPDEVLVNCADQFNRSCNYSDEQGGPVRNVYFNYDEGMGVISVMNDGQGFPICPAEQLADYDSSMAGKYSVELLMTREHAGTNKNASGQFNGGIHGIGLKAVIANTTRTVIETVNAQSNFYYRQEFLNGMSNICPPVVIDLNDEEASKDLTPEQTSPHTTFIIELDYKNLCKSGNGDTRYVWFCRETSQAYSRYLETRCYQLAAYFSSMEYRYEEGVGRIDYHHTPQVYFNGKLIRIRNLREFASMFPLSGGHFIKWSSTDMTYLAPWHVYVGVRDEVGSRAEAETMSFINSVYLPEGGSHITMLLTKLRKGLAPFVAKALTGESKKAEPHMVTPEQIKSIEKLLFLFDSRQAPLKGFESQGKGKLVIGKSVLSTMNEQYNFSQHDLTQIWALVGARYIALLNAKSESKQILEEPKVQKVNFHRIPDFQCSEYYGPSHADKTLVIICEGKSAAIPIGHMVNSKLCPISRKLISIFIGRGVPIGSLKRATLIEPDHEVLGQRYKPSVAILNNRVYTNLAAALGLNYNYHYFYESELKSDRDPELAIKNPARFALLRELRRQGDQQWETLNTHMIVLATDQDVDGMGQIAPQYCNWIQTFWPQLLRRPVGVNGKYRFLNRLETPIIRAYPKRASLGAVLEFFSEMRFDSWAKERYPLEGTTEGEREARQIDLEALKRDYKTKYYKGLGGHGKEELDYMTSTMLDHIIAIGHSEMDREAARIMYGKGTADRKRILASHDIISYNPELLGKGMILFGEMLMRETKLFQMDACNRKLPSPIDGLVDSQRKVLAGARLALSRGDEVLVHTFSGKVVDLEKYKHGNDPLNMAITMMAQNFIGSNWIPHLMAISFAFGSRAWGRDVTGSPRYIYLTYNKVMNLMFPPIDDLLLEYNLEEGTSVEPKYYVPVLPMSILTTYTTTAAGWKISSWARDFRVVVNNVRRMITFSYPEQGSKPISMLGKPWLAEGMRCVVGKLPTGKAISEICLGSYTYDEDKEVVHITQMPLKIWTGAWRRDILGLKQSQIKKEMEASLKKKSAAGVKKSSKPKAPARSRVKKQDDETDEEKPQVADVEEKIKFSAKNLVDSVFDETSDTTDFTDVRVKLKKGAIQQIRDGAKPDELLDPIEQYLDLRTQMNAELNMQDENGFVRHFDNYEQILEYWFIRRKNLYIERINRNCVLMKLRVMYYDNVLRYIEADSKESKEFNVDGKEDAEREQILSKHRFVKFYTTPLFDPVRATGEGLRKLVLGSRATYDYIGNLKKSDYWAKGIEALRTKREEAIANLREAERSTWQGLWTQELDKLVEAIEKGLARRWNPNEKKIRFASAPDS